MNLFFIIFRLNLPVKDFLLVFTLTLLPVTQSNASQVCSGMSCVLPPTKNITDPEGTEKCKDNFGDERGNNNDNGITDSNR